MIKDIFKAINKKIKETFPGIVIQSTDITEGFSRPSFYVDFDYMESDTMNSFINEDSLGIEIYYFPSDQYTYKIELIEVLQKLKTAFVGTLNVNENTKIHILECEASKNDGVLIFSFEIKTYNKSSIQIGEEVHPVTGAEYEQIEKLEIELEE